MELFQEGSIAKRFSDLMRANINDLLARAEDPEKKYNQWLIDAESIYRDQAGAAAEQIAAEKMLQMQFDQSKTYAEECQQMAKKAVAGKRDDLATEMLKNKGKAETQLKKLAEPLASAKARAEKARQDAKELREKIDDAKMNGTVLIARARSAKAELKSREHMAKFDGSSIQTGMQSMEEQIMAMEARNEALAQIERPHADDLKAQIDALGQGGIEDQLAALKKELKEDKKK